MKQVKILAVFLVIFFLGLASTSQHRVYASYFQIDTSRLENQMLEFSSRGAKGFLYWQYSGNLANGEYFANDPYSFFQNTENGRKVCQSLAKHSSKFEFVGVNMWDVGDPKYSAELIKKHFSWLKSECKVSVVRFFAKAGGVAGAKKILDVANEVGIKAIIAIGDYSNGGGGIPKGAGEEWYQSGYNQSQNGEPSYRSFAESVSASISQHPALYAIELANEPHCGGQPPSAIDYYTNWGRDVGGLLRNHSPRVGYGQMAAPNGVCDSPFTGGFETTNKISEINTTSAHFYNEEEYQSALAALDIAKKIGKDFYIGEASWKGTTNTESELIIPLILQPDSSKSLEDQLMNNMIVDQGYEVSCASPELGISPKALGLLMGYFDRNQDNPRGTDKLWLTAGSSIDVNFLMAEVPIYREGQKTNSSSKTESYEGYFGNNLFNQEAETTTNAGVANNLLSPSLQCKIKMDNLVSISSFCHMLENPNSCAMHEKISGSKYYLFSTSAQEPVFPSILTAYQNSGLECDQLMGDWQSDYLITQEAFDELANAINNTPLDFGKLFRMAFIVISPQQDEDKLNLCFDTVANRQDKFWFLRKRDDKASNSACEQFTNYQGKNPPIVIALKIPTFATNSILSYPIYDSGTITANIFDTISNQPDNQETEYVIKSFTNNLKTSREEKLRIAFDKQTQSKASEAEQALLVINCSGTTACDGAHGAGTELTRALVNIINANDNSCLSDKYDNPPISANEPITDERLQKILYDTDNPNPLESYEYASHISSPADYQFNSNRAFLAEHYNVMLNSYSLGVENWYWGLEVDRTEAEKIKNNVDGEHLKQNLKAHLVAPIGTNLSYVETMLSSLFSTESLKTLIENNELIDSADVTYQDGTTGPKTGDIARYLPILNTTLRYDAQAWTVEYPHADACPCEKTEVCLDIPKPTDPSKCVNKETFCETIVVDWPSGSNQEDKKIACVKGGVAFRDNYLDNEQQMGFAIKGAKLGFFIRKIQLAVTQVNSLNESFEYLTSCERIEDLFLGRCGGSPNKYSPDRDYTRTPRSDAPNSCMYRGMKVVVPSECALVKMVSDKAAQYDLDPTMLWGLIKIENPSFLEAVQRGQLETNCAVNACGAIGPFQILQGVCVQLEACMELEAKILGGQPEDYRDFVINNIMPIRRNVNPCDIVEALDWTAETLSARKAAAQKIIDDLPPNRETWEYDIDCRLAGYHWGDTTCTPDVSPACKGQSYCQCACEETRDVGRYSTSSGGTFESLRQSCGL